MHCDACRPMLAKTPMVRAITAFKRFRVFAAKFRIHLSMTMYVPKESRVLS